MTYYSEENNYLDFSSDTKIYDCIDEKSPYLIIFHIKDSSRQGYYRINSKTLYTCLYSTKELFVNKKLIQTTSKEELKIWMDLNGYKITDKIVVYSYGTKKIHSEMFKLEYK